MTRLFAFTALAALTPLIASATPITFISPTDPTGAVFTTNNNDGYEGGRGIVFLMTGDTTLDSIGIFQDLSEVTLSYQVFHTSTVSGNVHSEASLIASGSALEFTQGLQWIDFTLASPLTLLKNNSYEIAFSFSANSNQNFFYNNQNERWSQGTFSQLDGTDSGGAENSVLPAIRVNAGAAVDTGTPEPASVFLALGGLAIAAVVRRRALA